MAQPLTSSDAFSRIWESEMGQLAHPAAPGGPVEVNIESDGGGEMPALDPSGAISIPTDDGGVVVQFPGAFNPANDEDGDHDQNLAEVIDEGSLGLIGDDVGRGVDQDEQDRSKYINNLAKGIDLLALAVESPRADAGAGSSMEGMSTVRNPLLLEAVLRFQANARGELLPSGGPVKVKNDGQQGIQVDQDANLLEKDMNTYLTTTAKEYYSDTDRMLFSVGFGGCGFKKIYHCPLDRRPKSESVDAKDLIVPSNAINLHSALRVTQRIQTDPNTVRLMQLIGVYRDVDLNQPMAQTANAVDAKISQVSGQAPNTTRPEDQDYTLYECYCKLDLPGFEDTDDDGNPTKLKLPYKVTFDKDTKQVLEIRRNWDADDETKTAKRVFVKYPFVPGLGFYDIGLLNILGNATSALTAAWRIALDNGMFSNFPGFMYSKQGIGRQLTNEFRVAPGCGVGIDIGNQPINTSVMPLPYKGLDGTFAGLMDSLQQTMQRVGGTAETNVGEGRADAPVGTAVALIEQAKVIMDAVHKRLHAAQAEEFQLLKCLFQEDPEAFWRHNKSPQFPKDKDRLLRALENNELVPVADPNIPSSMHRHAKNAALMQMVQAYPQLFDIPTVLNAILIDMKFDNPQELLAKQAPAGPPPDPKLMIQQMKTQTDMQKLQAQAVSDAADRKSREDLALIHLASTKVIHPASAPLADNLTVPAGLQ